MRSARSIYLVISAGGAFVATVVFTITALYRIESAGFNPFELVVIGTLMEAAVFIFEIPTGIVADVYSRRLSVIIGNIGMGAAFLLEGAYPHVGTIMAAQILWGITYTFTSGATEAWLAGEIGEQKLTDTFLRAQQLGQLAALAGIVISISLGHIELWVPIVAGGVLQIALGVWLIFVMPETGFTRVPPSERETWTAMRTTARDGFGAIRRSRTLVLLMFAAMLAGAASEPFDRLWEAKYLKEVHFPSFGGWSDLTWFGILNVTSLILGVALSTIARRRVKEITSEATLTRVVAVLMAVQVIGLAIFGLAGGFAVATIGFLLYERARSLQRPFYGVWVIPLIEPEVRGDGAVGDGPGRRDRPGRRRTCDWCGRHDRVAQGRFAHWRGDPGTRGRARRCRGTCRAAAGDAGLRRWPRTARGRGPRGPGPGASTNDRPPLAPRCVRPPAWPTGEHHRR